ncbi:immunoglobulin-like domain-containing protein [Carnobacterium divergens]|uniref:Uncharacterized protein n=1 Tax=Carnobacterium divergens DSM 20623 TaxID=1449336 RepID=A0A0R2HWG6_CARDV|nr:immunoglobulin-like domain-containing protein [Carnobacterium divergens]KRN57017.1 hypothetical protein IV74_GL000667 [Carnobacterium divergens DSM 20623]MDO0874760.1 DUF5011 domain-containing protein [Carnobacterium divergens]SUX16101.1 Uncharacterised protein [Carnobacterium divergens]
MNLKITKTVATILAAVTISTQVLPAISLAAEQENETTVNQAQEAADTTAVEATENGEATNEKVQTPQEAVDAEARALGLVVWGKTIYSGSADKGLQLKDGITTGNLGIQLDIQKIADISWGDRSDYVIKLPEEFRELAKTEAFRNSITGKIRAWNIGFPIMNHTYTSSELRVDTVNNTIVFQNPSMTTIIGILPHITMNLELDLGKAITESGVRIADAQDGFYHVQTALSQRDNIIDWNLGSTDSRVNIPISKMDPGYGDTAPEIIIGDNKELTVPLNSVYDDAAALKDVKAYDTEDGWITNKLVVESNQVDTSREGYYKVKYSVVDSVGLKTTKEIEIHVTNTPPVTGSIKANDFTVGDSNITGIYAGDVAKLRLYINGVSVAWGGNLENGKFTFYAANQNISATDIVTMNAYDKNDKLLQENAPVKVNNATVSGSISPAEYSIGNAEITGNYTGDVAKARVTINGQAQGFGGSFNNGQFTYYVGAGKIKAGDVVTITAYDKNDKVLDANKPVKIKAAATQGTISPAEYSVGDTEITGSYTGDVAKARVTINGKAQAWGGSFNNGRFTYYVGSGKIKAGDVVTITAYDKNDKVLDANKAVSIKSAATQGTISPAEYSVGDTEITGSYTGDVAKARVTINGKAQAWGGSFNNGRFTYYVGSGKIKAGDTVTITAYDKSDKVLDSNKVVKIKAVVQGTISPSVYNVGETTIKGSYTGDIVRARVLINGEPQAWGGTFSGGSFSYYIGAGKIKAGDNVKIVGYSEDNSELSTKVVTVQP